MLRKELDLYANIRPAKAREGVPLRCGTSIDLVIVRENTEGFYADRSMHMGPGEFMPTPEVALAVRKVTRSGSLRIAEQAFLRCSSYSTSGNRPATSRTQSRKSPSESRSTLALWTTVNFLRRPLACRKARLSDGLFLDCVREVAGRFPEVEYEEQLIDAMAALLVRDPSRFDVVVATNMFGDILSDQASEISGSLGLGASLNAGETQAIAQAQHGSAPDIAGKDLANPVSLISSTAMLLNWLGERSKEAALIAAAAGIEQAISGAIADKATRTRDIGGPLGTRAFTDAVIGRLETAG